jgi:hypothetical protein
MEHNVSPIRISITSIVVGTLSLFISSQPTCGQTAPANALVGDARLSAKYSFHFRNMPVRDVLADMNQETGVRFFTDAAVADNRLSLIVHNRPLSETLKAISDFYQWQWRKDEPKEKKAQIGYTLLQPAEAKKREKENIEQRLDALAAILLKEAEAYKLLAPQDQKVRENLEGTLPSLIAAEKDPDKQQILQVQSIVLQDLHERRLWTPSAYKLIQTLSREQISALVRSSTTCFSYPTIPGCIPIPEDLRGELTKVFGLDLVPSGAPRGQVVSLRLRFTLVAGRQPYLRTSLQVGQKSNYGFSSYGMVAALPSSHKLLPETVGALPPIEPADWRKDASLTSNVSVRIPDSAAAKAEPQDQKPVSGRARAMRIDPQAAISAYWMSDAIDKIDSTAPLDCVMDGLWTTRINGIDMQGIPLGDALTRLSRATGHHWWKQDGFVMIQSRTLEADRWAEPPATSVARWKEQIDRGSFQLEDFAEIASLPDIQAMTLQEMATTDQFPPLASPLTNIRGQLALWNILTPAQRRKASGMGLNYSELDPKQQQAFVLAATDPAASPQSAAVPDAKFLTGTRLKVETQERAYWGVHTNGPLSTYRIPRGADADGVVEKREDIVRKFISAASTLKPDDIQPMTLVFHSFVFETDKEPFSRATVQMPPRWESQ